jgi:hypothetical protein
MSLASANTSNVPDSPPVTCRFTVPGTGASFTGEIVSVTVAESEHSPSVAS